MSVDKRNANIHSMRSTGEHGMDVIIISTSHPAECAHWQEKLESLRPNFLTPETLIFSIVEEWHGGAGNGLGTLYAFQAAQDLAKKKGINLFSLLQEGKSLALYHTAGFGKRLAPLSLSENNNKGSVLLPSHIPGTDLPLSILEAVLMQTSPLSKRGKGRLSVFWSDQIFIPSVDTDEPPKGHVDLFFKRCPFPGKDEWSSMHLQNYGIAGYGQHGPALIEKISYETFDRLKQDHIFEPNQPFGPCLGCFSLSKELLTELLNTFSPELKAKKGCYNSDPDFWMPHTLPESLYDELMPNQDPNLFQRIHQTFSNLHKKNNDLHPLSFTDIGQESAWWDFGSVPNYYHNLMKLLEKTSESDALRLFFDTPAPDKNGNLVIQSEIGSLNASDSLVLFTKAKDVASKNSMLIDCNLQSFTGSDNLLYKLDEKKNLRLESGQVLASAPSTRNPLRTSLERSGKEDWNEVLKENDSSYAQVFEENQKLIR